MADREQDVAAGDLVDGVAVVHVVDVLAVDDVGTGELVFRGGVDVIGGVPLPHERARRRDLLDLAVGDRLVRPRRRCDVQPGEVVAVLDRIRQDESVPVRQCEHVVEVGGGTGGGDVVDHLIATDVVHVVLAVGVDAVPGRHRAWYATRLLPNGLTSSADLPAGVRLYQTGVPRVSRIIVNDEGPRFAVTYQPGVGAPALGWGVAFTVGKSCGRQRIQVRADRPSAPVASSTAAWSSTRPTACEREALGEVVVGTRAVPCLRALLTRRS